MKRKLLLMAALPLLSAGFSGAADACAQTKVVAHRCFHENGVHDKMYPENSLAAFKRAQGLGIWGAEIDVWITQDDVVVVNHNEVIPTDKENRRIENVRYSEIKDVRLANGEPVPTLADILNAMKESKSDMKLVLEIKTHSKKDDNDRVVDKCIAMVREAGLEEQVVWIAFSYDNCCRIADALPDAMIQYLNGDKEPGSCLKDGIRGIDYSRGATSEKYVRQAHELGMAVNVWTVNTVEDMEKFLDLGVDFITTNNPDVLKELIAKRK